MLTENELDRYARQIMLPEVGEAGQRKIRGAKVLIVGVGGLGAPLALYLCAAGVGTIGLVDDDRVAVSNLQRQVLYTEMDHNRKKVEAAAVRLRSLNSEVKVIPHDRRFDSSNGDDMVEGYDLILDGCDNRRTRYHINDACRRQEKVYIYGSVAEFVGQVSVFNYRGGPTYRCLYPYDESVEEEEGDQGVIGPLPGIVASIQAAEAIKLICGCGTPLSGRLLLIDMLNGSFNTVSVNRIRREPE